MCALNVGQLYVVAVAAKVVMVVTVAVVVVVGSGGDTCKYAGGGGRAKDHKSAHDREHPSLKENAAQVLHGLWLQFLKHPKLLSICRSRANHGKSTRQSSSDRGC